MRRLDHEISGHLHEVGAPIELLRLVLEKIGARKGIAISLDVAPGGLSGNRRIAPAEFPSSMLGTEPPAFKAHGERIRIERIERGARSAEAV